MTYRAVFDDLANAAPILRRPANEGRRPAVRRSTPCARGDLPGFLQNACVMPGTTWTDRCEPLRITEFDPAEDVLSLEFDADQEMPELTFEEDEKRGVTTLLANGKPVAFVHLSRAGFSLDNVAVAH